MKKKSALLLLAFIAAVSNAQESRLLSKLEYYSHGRLDDYYTYQYDNGELIADIHVILDYHTGNIDSTFSYSTYERTKVGDNVETIRNYTEYQKDGVKRFRYISNSDGTSTSYFLDGDKLIETSRSKTDKQGRVLEYITPGHQDYNTYDSLGRKTGSKYVYTDADGNITKQGTEQIEFSADGLQSTSIKTYQEGDSPAIIVAKSVTTYDKKGRELSTESFDVDETDDEHPSFTSYRYKYRKRSLIRTNFVKEYKDGHYTYASDSKLKLKFVYNKRGLNTRIVEYHIKNGWPFRQSLVKRKYNRETGEPLRETHYNLKGFPLFRKPSAETIWTYE